MLESWPASLRVHVETINNRGLLAIPAWEHTGSAQTQLFKIINFLSKALRFPIWESICLQNAGNHIQVKGRKELERGARKKGERGLFIFLKEADLQLG